MAVAPKAASRKRPRAVEAEQPAEKKPRTRASAPATKPAAKAAPVKPAAAATKQKPKPAATKPTAKAAPRAPRAKAVAPAAAAKKEKALPLSEEEATAAKDEAKEARKAKRQAASTAMMEIMPKTPNVAKLWKKLGMKVNLQEDPSRKHVLVDWQRKYWLSFQRAMIEEMGRKDARMLAVELNGGVLLPGMKALSMRPDRVAGKWFNNVSAEEWPGQHEWKTRPKCWGYVPGVCTNDKFYNRAEMSVLGMHRPPLAGIDYVTAKEVSKLTGGKYDKPVAMSIVLAGNYADDKDKLETCSYTGQGGNDLLGNKEQKEDQLFELGNLALAGNVETGIPVRVSRKNVDEDSCYGVVYTFDGLYSVYEWEAGKGKEGFTIFTYHLRRLPGQAPLQSKNVDFGGVKSVPLKITPETRNGIMCLDLSKGLEKVPVVVVNTVDQELPPGLDPDNEEDAKFLAPCPNKKFVKSSAPYTFRYITEFEYADGVDRPTSALPAIRACGQSDEDFAKELHSKLAVMNGGVVPFHHAGKCEGAMPAEPGKVRVQAEEVAEEGEEGEGAEEAGEAPAKPHHKAKAPAKARAKAPTKAASKKQAAEKQQGEGEGEGEQEAPAKPKPKTKLQERGVRMSKSEPQPLVFECGAWCGCPHGDACIQAPTALGLRYRVEIFKTGDERGWGARCWDTIPSGAVVCAFIGKIFSSAKSDDRPPDYHFEMAPRPPAEGAPPALEAPESKYFVDSRVEGNWSRFINHSCDPNLYVQPSCAGHHNADYPTVTFVAWRNIPALTELSYDYGEAYVSMQLEGKCLCGARSCRNSSRAA